MDHGKAIAVSAAERFWRFVNKNGPMADGMDDCCWLWTGSCTHNGYGQFKADTVVRAHVFSYELHYGKIPPDNSYYGRLHVLHRCDLRNCVNPPHLYLGTNRDNMKDKIRKGRIPRGEDANNAKLTWDTVRAIRHLHATGQWTLVALSNKFGSDMSNIGSIVRGETWRE